MNLPNPPQPGTGVHGWVMSAANLCRIAGLSQLDAVQRITEMMPRPPSPANEVVTAVAKAYSSSQSPVRPFTYRQAPVPLHQIAFDPKKLEAAANQITRPASWRHWLWARSPKRPESQNAFSFLGALYRPVERVLLFDKFDSVKPAYTVPISQPMDCRVPALTRAGGAHGLGVWFLCNPVDGLWHPNPRNDDKMSCRSEEAVTAFRYAVLESDTAPADQWLAFIAQLPLRIAAIYTSGGRSIHVLVRIDADSKAAWDAKMGPLKRPLKVLGADSGCLSGVRLTRLPQCWRPEKGGFQRLLYLCPDPPLLPLIKMPVLHSRAETLARWRRDCPRWNKSQEAFI